jgi:hypothetical protein
MEVFPRHRLHPIEGPLKNERTNERTNVTPKKRIAFKSDEKERKKRIAFKSVSSEGGGVSTKVLKRKNRVGVAEEKRRTLQ